MNYKRMMIMQNIQQLFQSEDGNIQQRENFYPY